ncbi:MAG: hypothetical protein FWD18_00015 [Micrococcales bacterium]|nr:hypothetical protein [Micrococcales bacterium]
MLIAPILVLGACTNTDSLAAEAPLLTIGEVSYPEPLTFAPPFDQISIDGQTYALPFVAQQLIDAGWVYHDSSDGSADGLDSLVEPFSASHVTLVRDGDEGAYVEGRSIGVTVMNTSFEPNSVAKCEVWSVSIGRGHNWEPHPGVHRGASREEIAEALGVASGLEPLPPSLTEGTGDLSRVWVDREPLSQEQVADLSAVSSAASRGVRVRAARVTADFVDGIADGYYWVQYAPHTQMTDGYILTPNDGYPHRHTIERCSSDLHHLWLLPSDLSSAVTVAGGRQVLAPAWAWDQPVISDSAGYVDGAAIYMIDGRRYAMAATNEPPCATISGSGDRTRSQHLFAGLDTGGPKPGLGSWPEPVLVDVGPEKRLLWDRDDSSAAVMIYRGPGRNTGEDTMQLVVNYADWERGTRLTFLYSLLALDEGVGITDGAANLLLTVAADATRSVRYSHPG